MDVIGLLRFNQCRKIADVTDGTSNTILMTEDGGRPAYYNSGKLISQSNATAKPPNSTDAVSGAGWADIDSEYETDGDGSNKSMNFSNNNEIYSFHPGGVQLPLRRRLGPLSQADHQPGHFRLADQLQPGRDHLGGLVLT